VKCISQITIAKSARTPKHLSTGQTFVQQVIKMKKASGRESEREREREGRVREKA